MELADKYGKWALVAGASEGIGASFAEYLASHGLNLMLVARRQEPLNQLAVQLTKKYNIEVHCICCDLAKSDATELIKANIQNREINILVYNAALSYIGPFEKNELIHNNQIAQANMITPMNMVHEFSKSMHQNGKGAIILMASLAGFQGSGFLTTYAASKAFMRIFAESLWYEWKNTGVDVIACCAGATSTPNFIKTNPEKSSFFAPRVQKPDEVVQECFNQLGKKPSIITGRGNKIASFIMQNLMPRKMSIKIMGDTTRKMYRI